METVRVELGERAYDIRIEPGLLQSAGSEMKDAVGSARRVMLISNPTVYALYGQQTMDSLRASFAEVLYAEIPDGESYKTMAYAMEMIDAAVQAAFDRKDVIVALGGGVIGDLAGFVASVYQRGIRFVQIPTTLLAQVDSSVGGKVAVNHPRAKNMIGAFHQPARVIIDPNVLATLEPREYISGLAEVVKYGIIDDLHFFQYLMDHHQRIVSRDPAVIQEMIKQSCIIKARVVGADERESGQRELLNLGHTFGHAYETCCGYGVYRHGEAVAMGIKLAARLAWRAGLLDKSEADRIEELLALLKLDYPIPHFDPAVLLNSMKQDKKARGGEIRFVLPTAVGQALVTAEVPLDLAAEVIRQSMIQ